MDPGPQLLLKMDRYDDPVSSYYQRNFKIQVEIPDAKVELSYVVCPRTFLDQHGNGTRLGFNEGGMLFLPKDMHPAMMPFAALYLHYVGMDQTELEEKFGAEIFTDLSKDEIDNVLLATVLDLAQQGYLLPNEMADFIERLRKEPDGNEPKREEIYRKVAGAYLSSSAAPAALAKRAKQSLEFYVGRISEKVQAHAHNKYVAFSRGLCTAFDANDRDKLRAWINSSEPAYQAIINDDFFRGNLSGVVRFLEALEGYTAGTRVVLPEQESRLMYTCLEAASRYRVREPFKFVDGPKNSRENRVNYLIVTRQTDQFVRAIRLRLLNVLAHDYEEAEKLVEGLTEVVRKVGSGDKDLASLIDKHITETRGLLPVESPVVGEISPAVPEQITAEERGVALEEAVAEAEERRVEIGSALTSAPGTIIDLSKAYRARKLLEDLGVSTEVVDQRIGQLEEASTARLAGLTRRKLG